MKQFLLKISIFLLLLNLCVETSAAPKRVVTEEQKSAISQTLTRILQREVKGATAKVTSFKDGVILKSSFKSKNEKLLYFPQLEHLDS